MKKIICFLLFCLGTGFCTQAQTNDSTRLAVVAAKLEQQTNAHPVEKVYLHLNKPAYNRGDTIWFKGYLTIGAHHLPSALSGILYVDLIDNNEKIVNSLRLKVAGATAIGQIALSGNMPMGDYRLRAYTNWMRNAGADYFFSKTINIGDTKASQVWVNARFDAAGVDGESPINAKLVYTGNNGRVYDRREVNYELKEDDRTVYKGSGITDANGVLTLALSNKFSGQKNLALVSHIQLLPGTYADKTIMFSLQQSAADVQFFPEGGQLLNGVRAKVAFKAIGINGLGIPVKGVVVDNEHKVVAEFNSRHAGMGAFALTPEAGKTYTAKITLPDSATTTVSLPTAVDKGFVLAVNNSDSLKINVRVTTNNATLSEGQNNTFYLIGQVGGIIYYATYGKLDSNSFMASISKDRFPKGIVQFTLFSSEMKPLNERVAFISKPQTLELALGSNKESYGTKEKVELAFLANDAANRPATGSFSLSVFNEDMQPGNQGAEGNILSGMLLTSDLKGYVERPGYYFDANNRQAAADLDLLMLTQGYRRFDWAATLSEQYPAFTFRPERAPGISGRLTTPSGKPVANGKISLFSMVDKVALDTLSDADGKFSFADVEFPDTTRLVLKAERPDGDKYVKILVDQPSVPAVTMAPPNGQLSLPALFNVVKNAPVDTASLAAVFKRNADLIALSKKSNFNFQKDNRLKEVVIKDKKASSNANGNAPWVPLVTRSTNLNGPGHANMVLTGDAVENCDFPENCLVGKIPGLMAKYSPRGDILYLYFASHTAQSITGTPAIVFIIDGMQADIGTFHNLPMNSILTIEVLESGSYLAVYGQNASYGALVVTTKNGNEGNEKYIKDPPGILTTRFKGFVPARRFYTPRYDYVGTNTIADLRDAVYWNPNIITDDKGTTPIEFYNSDVKGNYCAVIEGIDNNGDPARYVYHYKVE